MNNILQLRYALEVQKTGSISRAAENLYMGQPHLSRAIRELEESLGISIFKRTTKGVVPTPEGEEFLKYAKKIVAQIDEMETMYKEKSLKKRSFSVSVPRATYAAYAFTEFLKDFGPDTDMNIDYRETNSVTAINNVADHLSDIAVVRYNKIYEEFFLHTLRECDLEHKLLWDFECVAIMSEKHPLAGEDIISHDELSKFTRIINGDTNVPSVPANKVRKLLRKNEIKKSISVYDGGSQFEILSRLPTTYLWTSKVTEDVLKLFSLVQKKSDAEDNDYRDIIVFRKGYSFKEADEIFCNKLFDTTKKLAKI